MIVFCAKCHEEQNIGSDMDEFKCIACEHDEFNYAEVKEIIEGAYKKIPKVEQMRSPKTGNPIANQFTITTDEGRYFQSYRSIIAFIPFSCDKKTVLDVDTWDYSVTTGKYRNEFLGERIAETRAKIKNGTYRLSNLNY